MDSDINVLALVKGEEHYIFLYGDDQRVEALRTLGRYAADPQLSFTWYDAAVLSKKMREMSIAEEMAAEIAETSRPASPSPRRFSLRHEEDKI